MAEALTRKQVIQAVWNKFKAIIGNKDISGIGDGTVTGALVGLNGKTFKVIYNYSFWNVYLTIYGCDYLRYFCVKGTPENTFATNTTLTARSDCDPITGHTEFVGLYNKSLTISPGGEIKAAGAGWKQGEYFNISGFFVATQKI